MTAKGLLHVYVIRRGGQDNGATLHQELVDGEYLLFVEILRRDYEKQIDIAGNTALKIERFDLILLGLLLLQYIQVFT